MSTDPADQNPFKGTPLEHLFANLAGPGGPLAGSGLDMSMLMSQVQAMMQPHEGAVNWKLATDLARRTAAEKPDPTPSAAQRRQVADAVQLADHWLDDVTDLPSGVSTAAAWSKAEWIEETADTWATLVEPIAEHVVGAMSKALPDEAKTMAGPLMGMLSQAGSAMFGSQIGQALGALAGEVLTSSDIGLPLTRSGKAALLPANVEAFAEGLDIALEDVYLYLALREAAHQRLFAHVPWLSAHLIAAVADYGRGIDIDMSRIEQAMSSIDPMNPMAMQQALEGGMFEPEQTPAQAAALARLETALALVEGWVDEVVAQAAGQRMPTAAKLQEIIRRRRAAGGPAEETFAALVGLELRPRRLRDAAALWGALRARDGAAARDAVWEHPDLMPTSADLDDPLGYQASRPADYFDAELARLLDGDLEASDDAAAEGDEPPAVPEDPDADQ